MSEGDSRAETPASQGLADQAPGRLGRPSIYDVAAAAGVSHMTVSRVLNDHPSIRAATRDRVLAAIEETNYTRSSIARALATRRAMRVGVIVDSPAQYGPNSVQRAVEAAAHEEGFAVSALAISGIEVRDGVRSLLEQGVEALCLVAPRWSSLEVVRRRPAGVPAVVIKSVPEQDMHTVAVDQDAGAAAAVRHLIDLGHTRIAHLAGPRDWFDAHAREEAWRRELTHAGLAAIDPASGDWTADAGYDLVRAGAGEGATAIFAANDQMALGAIHALVERGVRIPEEVSVVGFDDQPEARHLTPPLTTVRQDFDAVGHLAVRQMLAAMEGEAAPEHHTIEAELIVRDSTAPPG